MPFIFIDKYYTSFVPVHISIYTIVLILYHLLFTTSFNKHSIGYHNVSEILWAYLIYKYKPTIQFLQVYKHLTNL